MSNNAKKKSNLVFKHYYAGLPEAEKTEIRNKFLSSSGISYPSFYQKLRYDKFLPLERKELNLLCGIEFDW